MLMTSDEDDRRGCLMSMY